MSVIVDAITPRMANNKPAPLRTLPGPLRKHGTCSATAAMQRAPLSRSPGVANRPEKKSTAENALLVLDTCARIRFCTDAAGQVFGHTPDNLLSTAVTTLIPRLPLRPNTPGYNLAYAAFQSGSSELRRFRGRHAEGHEFALDLSIKTMTLQGRHGLVIALRVPFTGDRAMEAGTAFSPANTCSSPGTMKTRPCYPACLTCRETEL